jgi:hypothetical protein
MMCWLQGGHTQACTPLQTIQPQPQQKQEQQQQLQVQQQQQQQQQTCIQTYGRATNAMLLCRGVVQAYLRLSKVDFCVQECSSASSSPTGKISTQIILLLLRTAYCNVYSYVL